MPESKTSTTIRNPLNINTDMAIDLLQRFFYQILGIYLPAFILFLFIHVTWKEAIVIYFSNFPEFFKDNIIYQVILLLIGSVILGEGINAFTAWLTKISPINLPFWHKFKYAFKKPIHVLLKDARWPIWINVASFPVTFAVFDRYYITTLDKDRKTLAGKIGWTSFYRNFGFVFFLMILIQFPYLIGTLVTLYPKFQYITSYFILNEPETFINNMIPVLSNIFPYILPIFLFPAFIIAYRHQIKSNKTILWNAYRHNELRKVFEEKYGDLEYTLNFSNEEDKAKITYYIVDRWFLAIESTIRDLASYIISKLELQYKDNIIKIQNKRTSKKIREDVMEVYEELYRSNYEIAISLAIKTLEKFQVFLPKEKDILSDEEWWKFIKGSYLITFVMRTEKVYKEVKEILGNTNPNKNNLFNLDHYVPKINNSEIKCININDYSKIASNLWDSTNKFHSTFTKIKKMMDILEESKINLENESKFYELCVAIGGYDYNEADKICEEILDSIQKINNKQEIKPNSQQIDIISVKTQDG